MGLVREKGHSEYMSARKYIVQHRSSADCGTRLFFQCSGGYGMSLSVDRNVIGRVKESSVSYAICSCTKSNS